MSKITKRGNVNPEMNMTPLIDVTFQLIIFFMLINNVMSEETVEMIVPKLEDPQVRELDEGSRLTINVVPMSHSPARLQAGTDPLITEGRAEQIKLGSLKLFPMEQAGLEALKRELEEAKRKNPTVEIVLRADAAANYISVQPVMEAITGAGIIKINMMAFQAGEGPENLRVEGSN
jgi:biopolymer transport protein ExbD